MINKDYFAHETACIEDDCTIGEGTKIWHFSHIMKGSVIGRQCNIGQNVVVSPGAVLGDGVKVQNNVSVYTGVICEDSVFLGPSCVFTNVINPRAFLSRKDEFHRTLVRHGASIGANVTIVCGCTIGKFAMIGAGSVVTKDVPDYAVVAGVPAKVIKYRFTAEQIRMLNEIAWWDWPVEKIQACYDDFIDIDLFLQKHYPPK